MQLSLRSLLYVILDDLFNFKLFGTILREYKTYTYRHVNVYHNIITILSQFGHDIYLFMIGFYILSICANTSEPSAGSQVWCLGPFSDFQLRLRSSVCYRTPSLQPKYETTGVNYTALYDYILLQLYSVQPTLVACPCRGPRNKFNMLERPGIEPWTLCTSSRVYNHQTTQAYDML